jgi:hypothetical protein
VNQLGLASQEEGGCLIGLTLVERYYALSLITQIFVSTLRAEHFAVWEQTL